MRRKVAAMDRLTFLDNGKPAYRIGDTVYKNAIARRLYDYESKGYEPDEIIAITAELEDARGTLEMEVMELNEKVKALQADNKRLHELVNIIEGVSKVL